MHVFGSKEPGQEYKERRAVYGIIHDKSKRIGVIRLTYDQLLFLPGGGMEHGEDEVETLRREVLEETGYLINKPSFLCTGTQFFQSRDARYIQNVASFYSCSIGLKEMEPAEEDHELIWLKPEEAVNHLFHQHQACALRQWIESF
ncbi:NUDIX domain-containing protein [Terribacillus sp. 7520-G]|uniref:NUDIX domain-containing protein n=1 Tax=Terribacillus TaxID=459532 RepID=UPI000BA6B2E7|nr:NUDIX domain-containing protein [Terribacillus sp. 7520-G]PAD39783.1 hypothetical protein CHH53_04590 [Terribacillus sp. 7520-G]